MTDKTPPDWVLIEAAKRSAWTGHSMDHLRDVWRNPLLYLVGNSYRALCDMIEKYEQPPGAAPMTPTQEDVARSLRWRLAVTEELLKRSEKARIAAEERGARMALEAAAKVAESLRCPEQDDYRYALIVKEIEALGMRIATAIRQIDPAQIVKGQSDAD